MELLVPILLILAGLLLAAVEVRFMPRYYAAGLAACTLLAAGLARVFFEAGSTGGWIALGAVLLALLLISYGLWLAGAWDRYLLHLNLRSDLPGVAREADHRSRYLGLEGVAETPLRPSGIVKIEGERLEAAERRSALAQSGVDSAVLGLSRRLEALEDEREEESGEVETALARARTAQDELLDRIRKLERSGSGSGGEALKAVEAALAKFANRLYQSEREMRGELDTLALKEEQRRDRGEKAVKSLTARLEEAERKFAAEDEALRDRQRLVLILKRSIGLDAKIRHAEIGPELEDG